MRVKCKDCGYLAVRNVRSREMAEVEFELRNGGDFPATFESPPEGSFLTIRNDLYGTNPLCFAMKSFPTHPANAGRHFIDVIEESHNCDGFTPWKNGYSPKEHMEMQLSDKLLNEQRLWQSEQARIADDRHKESIAIANRSVRTAWIGASLGAFATVIAGLVAAWATFKAQPPQQPSSVVVPAIQQAR